mmetsp:Transcript_24324/g.46314  ORF Transcript_24324/g.46314 Transcript_24324/m.46314 type:complete len:104 (-) Transcript_24324:4568-4879(-)
MAKPQASGAAAADGTNSESINNHGDVEGGKDSSNNNDKGTSNLSLRPREEYSKFHADLGILSEVAFQTYLDRHKDIDSFDYVQRCRRFGYQYSATQNRNRRIF